MIVLVAAVTAKVLPVDAVKPEPKRVLVVGSRKSKNEPNGKLVTLLRMSGFFSSTSYVIHRSPTTLSSACMPDVATKVFPKSYINGLSAVGVGWVLI